MANVLYDFRFGWPIVPYVGGGLGIAFVNASALNASTSSTQFAYQGMIGVGYEDRSELARSMIEGRYFGTTNPTINNPFIGGVTYNNNNISPDGEHPATSSPPRLRRLRHRRRRWFLRRLSWCSSTGIARTSRSQALTTIQQAADAFKTKGNARITATGHTDTSGAESYNMALSLRRANAVKDALVRDGVPAQAYHGRRHGREGPAGARPPTACASRRTAASGSSSSKTETLRTEKAACGPPFCCNHNAP